MSHIDAWKSVVGKPFPTLIVTQKTKAETKKSSGKFRGSVRVATGNFLSDEEYSDFSESVRNTPLP